jgi:hypothetical protein
MNLEQIKAAVDSGKKVYWSNKGYQVVKDKAGDYVIKASNGHMIGLTWADGETLNGKEKDFFVGESKNSPVKLFEEFINESKYQVYHNSYTSAVNTALDYAESQGYTYDKDETFTTIGLGNRKPQEGDTNKFTITLYKNGKEQKKALQIQIYGMGNRYELNTYIA